VRLKAISIAGFRGFAIPASFDLDANAVIIAGVNGSGKTSLFDAILWALTGSIGRLSNEPDDVISRYSPSGEARVELILEQDGATVTVVRRFETAMHLTVESSEYGSSAGSAAETMLIDLIWPDAKSAAQPNEALSRSLTRAMYLQQDVVREFIEADKEEERFEVVSELVGLGRVTELQHQLESSRTAWSRATNTLERELEPLRSQMKSLDQRLQRLTGTNLPTLDVEAFRRWANEIAAIFHDKPMPYLRAPTVEGLENVLTELQGRLRLCERKAAAIERLLSHLRTPVPQSAPTEPLAVAVHTTELIVAAASEQLRVAQEGAAGERRRQAELHDQTESYRALAQLAMRHLGEKCPVCDQPYDRAATRARLEDVLGSAQELQVSGPPGSVQAAASGLEIAQRELAAAQAALRDAERVKSAHDLWASLRDELARDSGLEVTDALDSFAERELTSLKLVAASIQQLRKTGESFSLHLARGAELAQRSAIEDELATLRQDVAAREDEHVARSKTTDLGNSLLVGLRSAGTKIVASELSRIEPLLQRIYATVDPHPSFRAVNFLTRTSRGHGRLWTSIADAAEQVTVEDPGVVLSSSQLNVLAVSTFLALSLAVETLPLQVVALDDPLQSLDTVNLLGLADLLRRVRASRQVIVSTHDERLAELLALKLRPVVLGDRTRIVRLDAWTRTGPDVDQSDVHFDRVPLKLLASA
jgi:DNA repair exonuclease SbcCD ATPase subunit